MAFIRKSLTDQETQKLLSLKSSDITLKLLQEFLAYNEKNERMYDPLSELIITKSLLQKYQNELDLVISDRIVTTVGRYFANLFLFANMRLPVPYFNFPIDKKGKGKINNFIDDLLKEEKITSDQYIDYINRMHWFSFSITSFIAYTLDVDIIKPLDIVTKRKKELFKINEKAIANNDQKIVGAMEKELLGIAQVELEKRNSPGMYVYNSGGSGSFGNNYKNTCVMRGSMAKSSDITNTNAMSISSSNLMDGIAKDELDKYSDISVLASFSRAVGTQDGGYVVKQFNASFSHIQSDPSSESDCGTSYSLPVSITESNMGEFYLRYVIKGKDLILLDRETLKSYAGKKVNMRSPLFCKNAKVCSRCMGQLYYRLGLYNIGNLTSKMGSTLLNKSLKRFHDLSVHTKKIDVINSFISV